MANYDAKIRVHTEIDNSDIKRAEKEINQYAQSTANKMDDASNKLASGNKEAGKLTGTFDSLSGKVDDYRSLLDDLASRGFGFGDANYDEAYIQWKNATYAVDEYKKSLDEATVKGQQLAQEKQGQLVEKELEKQERIRAVEAERIAEEERLAAIKANAVIADQRIVALTNEKMLVESRLAELKQAGVGVGYEEYDKLKVQLSQINSEINEYCNSFKTAEQSAKKCFKSVENGAKNSKKSFDSTMKGLKNIIVSMVAFQVMAKGAEYVGEGFKNLIQYSSELNGAFSDFKSETATLKNSLATAFAPIVAQIIPYITGLVSWLNKAMNVVSQFWAVLSGKNTYTKAKKQVVGYAKSLKDASKAAKGALASFDELNILNGSDSTSTDGELSGADAFEESKVDEGFVLALEKVKALLELIAPLILFIGGALGAWKLASLLGTLMKMNPVLGTIVGWLVFIVGAALSIYNYIAMWKDGVDWSNLIGYIAGVSLVVGALYALFGPLAAGIALIIAGVAGVVLALRDIIKNGMNTKNMALLLISCFGILAGVFVAFGGTAALIVGAVMAVIGVLAALVSYGGNGAEALGHLQETFKALSDFVTKIFAGDMEGAFESLKEAGKSFGNFFISVAEGIANGFIRMVNSAIDAINKLSFDVPDWLQEMTGVKTFGFNIPNWDAHVSLPRLATGGIVTSSTIANIGEAGREAVLPLENNTGWMDDLAQKLADKMPGNNQTINIVAELDGREVYRSVVRLDKQFYKTTGRSQFSY